MSNSTGTFSGAGGGGSFDPANPPTITGTLNLSPSSGSAIRANGPISLGDGNVAIALDNDLGINIIDALGNALQWDSDNFGLTLNGHGPLCLNSNQGTGGQGFYLDGGLLTFGSGSNMQDNTSGGVNVTGHFVLIPTNASTIPLAIKLAASQTGNSFEINSSSGSGGDIFNISASGVPSTAGHAGVTGSFTTANGKTVTVANGFITAIV